MKLLKKWRKNDAHDRSTALAKRGGDDRAAFGGGGSLGRLRDEMDRLFDRAWRDMDGDPWSLAGFDTPLPWGRSSDGGWNWPAVDMDEDENSITLRVDVPGLDAKDLNVEVSGNLLTVRGSREEERHDRKRHRHERLSGSFHRTVTLPAYADGDRVDARYEKGVLTVTVPKVPGRSPRRVQITTS